MIFDNKKKGGGSHRVVAQGDEGNGKIPFMVFFLPFICSIPTSKKSTLVYYTSNYDAALEYEPMRF